MKVRFIKGVFLKQVLCGDQLLQAWSLHPMPLVSSEYQVEAPSLLRDADSIFCNEAITNTWTSPSAFQVQYLVQLVLVPCKAYSHCKQLFLLCVFVRILWFVLYFEWRFFTQSVNKRVYKEAYDQAICVVITWETWDKDLEIKPRIERSFVILIHQGKD